MALGGAGLIATPAAHADPVVCATVYYTINNGPTHYIVNNCYVPSPWGTQMSSGPVCGAVTELNTTVRWCHFASVAFPVP